MTSFLARSAVLAAMFAVTVGNYWYAFGLWPKSWTAYAVCYLLTITCVALNMAIDAESKKG